MPLPNLIIGMLKLSRSLTVEINSLFQKVFKLKEISKQAFSFARKKMNPLVFAGLHKVIVNGYYADEYKKYKDQYLVFACDGTGLQLPMSKEIICEYGCPSTQNGSTGRPVGNLSVLYDIYNKIIVNGILKPYAYSEKAMAEEQISYIRKIQNLRGKKIIILFDRGYPSMNLITKLVQNKINFIIRYPKNRNKDIQIASKRPDYDKLKQVKFSKDMLKNNEFLRKYARENNNKISLRFISGRFSDKEIAVFITNLNSQEINREEIIELYRTRWQIETEIKYLKGSGEIENLACKTVSNLKQEIYCKILSLNLSEVLIEEAQEIVDKKVKSGDIKTKYELKVNRNVVLGTIKEALPDIIWNGWKSFGDINNNPLTDLILQISKNTCPVKKNRVFERKPPAQKRTYNIQQRKAC